MILDLITGLFGLLYKASCREAVRASNNKAQILRATEKAAAYYNRKLDELEAERLFTLHENAMAAAEEQARHDKALRLANAIRTIQEGV